MDKPKAPDMGFAFGLKPEAAVRYFETLGYDIPADWHALANQAQSQARTIAGIYRQDIVADLHRAMQASAYNGTPFAAWQKDIRIRLAQSGYALDKDGDIVDQTTGEVAGTGLTKHRLEIVYRTNMQNAFMAGEWQALQANKNERPYLMYTAVNDYRTRPAHRAMDGLVYHIDDEFWHYFFPPNGFGCRCKTHALSQRDLERGDYEISVSDGQIEEVHVTNRKGESTPVKSIKLPDGRRLTPDKGFDRNVGMAHLAQLGQLQMARAVDLPPRLAAMAVGQALQDDLLLKAIAADMAKMVQKAKASGFATGQFMHVGVLPVAVLDALAIENKMPVSAVISANDERLWHAWRDKKAAPLPADFWEELPVYLTKPDEVRLSPADRQGQKDAILMTYDLPDGKGKMVVTLDYEAKTRNPFSGKKELVVTNMVNTGTMLDIRQAESLKGYKLIWKKP